MDGESIKGMALQPELLLRAEQLLLGPLGECLLSATGSTSFFALQAWHSASYTVPACRVSGLCLD